MITNNPEWADLSEVKERVIQRLPAHGIVHQIHFIPINAEHLEIYVFFNRDEDLAVSEKSGVTQTIKNYFNEELEQVSRGANSGVTLRFEFDSHENVLKNFQGSYFLRLR